MPAIIIACSGAIDQSGNRSHSKHPEPSLSLSGQEQATWTALDIKRDSSIAIRRIVCSGRTSAYQTALVMALVLDIPMSAIRRDERLDECAFALPTIPEDVAIPYDFTGKGGEDCMMVLARHLAAMLDHGHGALDSPKAGLLLIGHPLGLKTLSHHFRQPGCLLPGKHRMLRL